MIQPPKNEDGLHDDAGNGTRSPHLFYLVSQGWKLARIPRVIPFFDEVESAQAKVEEREDERNGKEYGKGESRQPQNVAEQVAPRMNR